MKISWSDWSPLLGFKGMLPVFLWWVAARSCPASVICLLGRRAGEGSASLVFACFLCPVMWQKLAERILALLLLSVTQSLHYTGAFWKAGVQLTCPLSLCGNRTLGSLREAQGTLQWHGREVAVLLLACLFCVCASVRRYTVGQAWRSENFQESVFPFHSGLGGSHTGCGSSWQASLPTQPSHRPRVWCLYAMY